MRRSFSKLAFLFLLFACTTAFLHAQDRAVLTGVVTDQTGAVIPGASVDLANPSTSVHLKTTTNSAGSYRFDNVPPGPNYVLSFTQPGFAQYTVKSFYVNVGIANSQNAKMSPGAVSTEIEVSAGEGVTLNTEDATIGDNVQVESLNSLPVQNRLSPAVLFSLQPGVTSDGSSAANGSVLGSRVDQGADVTVDGLDVNDFATGNFGAITGNAPVDSVQEFRGTVGGFTATSGQGGGGQFQLVTRSGTNHWHGNASEYHRDNSTTANDWFNNLAHIRAPKLVQNQFGGSVGGPIKHDKLFFFFDFVDNRIAQDAAIARTVPLPSYKQGNISYINNNAGCTRTSRQNTTPNCISFLTPAQVKAMDPAGVGESPALFKIINARYPDPNDLTGGDGVNSGYFRFNAPIPTYTTVYVGKVDYNLTSHIRLWGKGQVARENQVNGSGGAPQFPGDPPTVQFIDRSYQYVGGMDWQIGAKKFNQLSYGSTVQDYSFPKPSNPLGTSQISFATGTTTPFTSPYASPSNSQARHVPIPQVTDNFSWNLGRHAITLGGSFKWIHATDNTVLDINSFGIGLGGHVLGLNSGLRPANLLPNSSTANTLYDSAFTAALGRVASISGKVNYDASGNPLPFATGSRRSYQYYQPMLYVSDSWKVTPNLTLTFGLNWQYFSVPYETNGLETVQTMPFDTYFADRVKQSAAGISGPTSVPFLTYVLGGKANNGPGYYAPDWKNYAPRFAFDWNPSFDSKTVFSGSAGIVYDRTIVNAVQYQQDQYSYLFSQPISQNYGSSSNVAGSLATDKRYDAPPGINIPSTPKPPFTPYVSSGIPTGLQNGGAFNEMIDPTLKTPYSLEFTFGMQHEFASSTLLRVSWASRLGRRLLGQADSDQLVDFPDKASGQLMSQAITNMELQIRGGANPANLTAQPWIENQAGPGYGGPPTVQNPNGTTTTYPNYTSLYADQAIGSLLQIGDFADSIQALSYYLPYNVGMGAQFSENTFYTNKGFSTYNGLLVTLHQNVKHGLQFETNYTWAHSIDNVSLIANSGALGGYGFICDALRPRLCRGNSDFDITHTINGWFSYSLPFGRGRSFAAHLPLGLDELLGGWDISGITRAHSGVAFTAQSNAFIAGYANDAPALFTGSSADTQRSVHKTSGGQLFLFSDPNRAVNAFSPPTGFNIGARNTLRGPKFFGFDAGLAKSFALWPDKGLALKLRADAFNVLNHPNFLAPGNNSNQDNIQNPSNFGQLTAMNGGARVVQLAVRLEF
ncbi:MAG TPA: carboxypeptidase-like regulatory domain-containing protein [Acidobacteriaceae bacterium]|nr:carboxypeptidase-like regulatory domain-containing protein [Acidobacteriaceae bacterium]